MALAQAGRAVLIPDRRLGRARRAAMGGSPSRRDRAPVVGFGEERARAGLAALATISAVGTLRERDSGSVRDEPRGQQLTVDRSIVLECLVV